MDSLIQLAKLFERFPGIGPRQAQRFVQYLLRTSPTMRRELAAAIQNLASSVRQCTSCMRWHDGGGPRCSTCSSSTRDASLLMLVATDTDRAAVEQSNTFAGHYFVLGGTIPLSTDTPPSVRKKELLRVVKERAMAGLNEVICAFPANPEGDATAAYVHSALQPLADEHRFSISVLGRGLSTGSELEYADPDTIKNALLNRK